MNNIYTMNDWQRYGFSAVPGQQVALEVYEKQREAADLDGKLKPLPYYIFEHCLYADGMPVVHEGFMAGDPVGKDEEGNDLYRTFGANQFGKPEDGYKKCFYLGNFAYKEEPPLNGKYYLFDCLDADLDGLHEASEFESDAEAIKMAADYEASLYSREYVDGVYEESKVLYESLFG